MPVIFAASRDAESLLGSASHVSAKDCTLPCPPSLQHTLEAIHLGRTIWLESYAKEKKTSLLHIDTFKAITLDQYQRLHELGAPQATPSMCVLVIKTYEKGQPDRASHASWSLVILKPVHGVNMNVLPQY